MMNYIWFFLMATAILVAAFNGTITAVTDSAISMASTAVEIALGLIGIMTLWLGMMKIAEHAGLVRLLARLLRPISAWLFPDVPKNHPAIGAIMMNLSANWLGLGNAATPFGIKAMEHLQELNSQNDTATPAMIMFLGLNTASITLVPMTMIGVRTSLGSAHPAAIIGPTIFASTMATLAAIFIVKVLTLFFTRTHSLRESIIRLWKPMSLIVVVIMIVFLIQRSGSPVDSKGMDFFQRIITFLSTWMIPFLLLGIPLTAMIKKVKVYETFIEGAKEGFQVAIRIIPFLVAILVAIAMFRASGAMSFFSRFISPLTESFGMPAEVLPAALMRPFSGSGTLGIISELLKTHGPDSFIGYLGSTLYGCTETTFYVIAVYFGAVGIKKTRYAIPAGLFADVVGILAAVYICRLLFLPL